MCVCAIYVCLCLYLWVCYTMDLRLHLFDLFLQVDSLSHYMFVCVCVFACVYACVYVCVCAHVVFELLLYCTIAGSGCAFLVLCVFVCVWDRARAKESARGREHALVLGRECVWASAIMWVYVCVCVCLVPACACPCRVSASACECIHGLKHIYTCKNVWTQPLICTHTIFDANCTNKHNHTDRQTDGRNDWQTDWQIDRKTDW